MTPLRCIRQARGLRIVDVAACAGVCMDTVRRIDRGEFSRLRVRSLVKVAHALGVAPADLVPGLRRRPRGRGRVEELGLGSRRREH